MVSDDDMSAGDKIFEVDVMSKILTALVAVAAFGVTMVAMSSSAEAQWRGGWGWGPGPFVAGAIVGGILGAAVAPPYYYGPGPYPYGYGPGPYPYGPHPYYGAACRNVWNGYNWVHACY